MKQLDLEFEAFKRDEALDRLEEHRAPLVEMAKVVAHEIALSNGKVTSPEVLQRLRERGFGDAVDAVDRRFMGAVFRAGSGWERIGFENLGSHRRPVSVWRLKRSLGAA